MSTLESLLTSDDLDTLRDFRISLDDPRHVPAESDGGDRERLELHAAIQRAMAPHRAAVQERARLRRIVTICYAALMLAGALYIAWTVKV